MDLREFRVVVRIVDRVAKRALFAEEQMVALEGQCAEWKRIADELKAERNAAKQEAVSARQDAVTRAEADRKRIDGLMIQAQDMRAEIAALQDRLDEQRSEADRDRSARSRALKYSLQAEEARREIERLRAKLASRTVEWPEWAKVGARVRVRSNDCLTTQNSDRVVGEELVISKVDRRDWTIRAESFGWVHVADLEPVAEHVAPPVVSEQPIATQTRTQETAPVLPRVGDTVRLVKRPEMYGGEDRWSDVWGIVGQEGKMTENVHNIFLSEPYILVSTQGKGESVHRLREWPVSCIEVVK